MIMSINRESAKRVAKQLRSNTFSLPMIEAEKIVEKVKQEGDEALKLIEARINNVKLESLEVKRSEINEALNEVPASIIEAIKVAIERLKAMEAPLTTVFKKEMNVEDEYVEILYRYLPLERIGIYVPRSTFSYPSSLIMTSVPATLVGVESIAVVTPPQESGKADNKILAVCALMNIDEIYKVGGAQAIAALAYGTKTIKPVEKIFGAGGKFVTAAKFLVSKQVAIDMLAGPTELLILADESANSSFVAYDLLSQAEHGGDLTVLASNSVKLIEDVNRKVNEISENLARKISFILGEDIESLLLFAESLAPEHTQVVGNKIEPHASKIKNSGVVLLGEFTPSAASDYILGSNHILPTFGLAKSRGGLSPIEFLKLSVNVRANSRAIKKFGPYAITLAKAEGFQMHAKAIEVRLSELN